ncbi:sialate O-acetylesterase [Stieleria sp.]|uniref:sialate O-acetylesterase n=1 Tax=Stieleria sp. TaxID=2795976 RepID=UPI00356846E6
MVKYNFRATDAYVTDGAGETPVDGDLYPSSLGGLTAGWTAPGAVTRDRSLSVDVRLAGVNYTNNIARPFKVELPSTGEYEIRLAAGDAGSSTPVGLHLQDNGVTFASISGAQSGAFYDASGVLRTAAAWPTDNVAITHTFTSTAFQIIADGSDYACLAHLEITAVSPSDSITLTSPKANTPHQRDEGTDTAEVDVAGTYIAETDPASIEWRHNGGTWATLDASPSGGTFSETVTVPMGQGDFEVRFSDQTDVTASKALVTVGDIYIVAGQSNAVGQLGSAQTYSHASLTALMYQQAASDWAELADPTHTGTSSGSYWLKLATELMASDNVPVAFIFTAVSSTNLVTGGAAWKPTPTYGTTLTNAVARVTAANVNGARAVLWDQGETDATDGATYANELQAYSDLIDAFQTLTGFSSLKLITVSVGHTPGATAASVDAVRQAQLDASVADADIFLGPVCYTRSGIHWGTDADALYMGALWYYAIQRAFESGTVKHPELSSLAINDDTFELTFDADLKSGDTYPTALFSIDDGGAVTVSAATYVSARRVDVQAAASLSGAATLSMASGTSGSNVTPPRSASQTSPAGTSLSLPAVPFYDQGTDTTAPVYASGAIGTEGVTATLQFTETGSAPLLPQYDVTGFSLATDGDALSILAAHRTDSTEVTLYLSRAVLDSETVTVSYSSGNVTDTAENALATFGPSSITNNSTQTAGTYPTESQVLTGIDFGPTGADYTGNVVLPAVGTVLETTNYGASSALTGTLVVPNESEVESGVGFGAGGTEFEGALTSGSDGTTPAGDVGWLGD